MGLVQHQHRVRAQVWVGEALADEAAIGEELDAGLWGRVVVEADAVAHLAAERATVGSSRAKSHPTRVKVAWAMAGWGGAGTWARGGRRRDIISSATRRATDTAATRRGWVTATTPSLA